ncbi:MAG TPA: hypothetical protein PKG54_06850 [Phycisphaerae bacterium]|jgi:hypothetical protein|nr:hypothetical protein [Phycisphaerae bacterium]HOB74227.1 hypothetical protein [Phycisphaerae bacterium]HOJ55015.1 hypothetical protein [Phycisphaerae bacterium]HOL26964.1 hypothetical protein [Phycisphaerae bacterium]HPP21393.1 hypothetical protein [Phycisphaerae bacterium]
MIRLCGAALGFLAFSVTTFLGIAAGNTAEVTIRRAVGAMVVFCVLGLCTGWVANRVLDEHALAKSREMFPKEPEEEAPAESGEEAGEPATS